MWRYTGRLCAAAASAAAAFVAGAYIGQVMVKVTASDKPWLLRRLTYNASRRNR